MDNRVRNIYRKRCITIDNEDIINIILNINKGTVNRCDIKFDKKITVSNITKTRLFNYRTEKPFVRHIELNEGDYKSMVKIRPISIQFIDNPDKEVQLAAVKQSGMTIELIKNPDKDVQLAAVNRDGYSIRYIKNPDKDVQLAAVNQNGDVIDCISNPDEDVQLVARTNPRKYPLVYFIRRM